MLFEQFFDGTNEQSAADPYSKNFNFTVEFGGVQAVDPAGTSLGIGASHDESGHSHAVEQAKLSEAFDALGQAPETSAFDFFS